MKDQHEDYKVKRMKT